MEPSAVEFKLCFCISRLDVEACRSDIASCTGAKLECTCSTALRKSSGPRVSLCSRYSSHASSDKGSAFVCNRVRSCRFRQRERAGRSVRHSVSGWCGVVWFSPRCGCFPPCGVVWCGVVWFSPRQQQQHQRHHHHHHHRPHHRHQHHFLLILLHIVQQ